MSDEQKRFEQEMQNRYPFGQLHFYRDDGGYAHPIMRHRWEGWVAREAEVQTLKAERDNLVVALTMYLHADSQAVGEGYGAFPYAWQEQLWKLVRGETPEFDRELQRLWNATLRSRTPAKEATDE